MSRRDSQTLQSVARRIRFLRGEETQKEFAKRAGISRSALANYETGRSQPDDFTLSKIAKNLDISEDYFASRYDPLPSNDGELSQAALLGGIIEGIPAWTEDEATLVRILRLCNEGTISQVLQIVLASANEQEVTVTLDKVFEILFKQYIYNLNIRSIQFVCLPLSNGESLWNVSKVLFQV